jgi:hypothetical protein
MDGTSAFYPTAIALARRWPVEFGRSNTQVDVAGILRERRSNGSDLLREPVGCSRAHKRRTGRSRSPSRRRGREVRHETTEKLMDQAKIGRRRLLTYGAAGAMGAAAIPLLASPAQAETFMPFAWAQHPTDLSIPNKTWTKVKWGSMWVNETAATLDANHEKWQFPGTGEGDGLYSLMVEVAWENDDALQPHRRMIRVMQDGYSWAGAEVNSAVTNGIDDGIPQRHEVCMQPGVINGGDMWIEVWQNSGTDLLLKHDGFEAPSFMIAKISDVDV